MGFVTSDGAVKSAQSGGGSSSSPTLGNLTSADSPTALFLGADLTDSSGNGVNPLTVEVGSMSHPYLYGVQWFYCNDAVLKNQDLSLKISGDVTVFFQFVRMDETASSEVFVYQGSESGSTSTYNYLYTVWGNGSQWAWTHQNGSKTGNPVSFASPLKNGANGGPHTIAMVRTVSDNTVKFYLDGVLANSGTYTNDPDGGGLSRFYIGGKADGTLMAQHMLMRNVWVKDEAKNASEILAMHDTAMGG